MCLSQVKTFTWILLEKKYILELEAQIESQVKLNFKPILLAKYLATLLTWFLMNVCILVNIFGQSLYSFVKRIPK